MKNLLKNNISGLLKTVLIITGTVLLLMFLAPLPALIINIGNLIGIIVSGLIIISGLRLDKAILLIKKIMMKKQLKAFFITAVTAAAALALCFFIALGGVLASSATNADGQDTIIVLGCGVNGDVPSLMLSQRINAAYKYLEDNPDAVAVLSGGQGNNENISEAQCMYNVMTSKGIASDRLYLEDKSTNTFENITFSKRVIKDNELSDNIAIASADFHLKRATMIAAKQGIQAKRIASKTSLFLAPTYFVRDTLGVVKEFVFK